ncbi:MAG: carboxylating nicotinate-nucleotide diphosphorylase [Propionibacteriaceae bacterium]
MSAPEVLVADLAAARALVAACGLDVAAVTTIVDEALDEDLGGRGLLPVSAQGVLRGARVDVTSVATIPADATGTGEFVARAPGVVAGLAVAAFVVARVATSAGDPAFSVRLHVADGDGMVRGDVLATVTGSTRSLLTAERVALNLLTSMSGVATATRAWVDALAGSRARVRDSRKTVPGLRVLQKYAVRVGGGVNHRLSLADQALIKDNHVIAAGGVVPAFQRVRSAYPDLHVQVEVTSAAQAEEVIAAGATDVLLDNMSPTQMSEIVDRHRESDVVFEASGGLTVANAAEVAATGVHFVAVGAITHSAPIADIALDLT